MSTTFNLPLAVKVLAVIEESRQWDDWQGPKWDQTSWGRIDNPTEMPVARNGSRLDAVVDVLGNLIGWGTCGTAMCFAGWALSLERVPVTWHGTGVEMWMNEAADGRDPSEAAADVLGIDWTPHPDECVCEDGDPCPHEEEYPLWHSGEDMPLLFHGPNSLGDLYRIVADHADVEVSALREMVGEQMKEDREAGLTQA